MLFSLLFYFVLFWFFFFWILQDTGISVHHDLIEEALTGLQGDTLRVVDVFPACPFSLLGVACNYQCRLGAELTAPVDGMGGHIAPIYLGMKHQDAYHTSPLFFIISPYPPPPHLFESHRYNHARPRCNLPLDCGRTCTAALQRVLYECQDFADEFYESYRADCQLAIERATFFCVRCIFEKIWGTNTNEL